MHGPPRVSVVVPTRDRAPVLLGCLLSLLGQQGGVAFEVVVVDDGSADHTGALVASLAATSDVPVRYERSPGRGPNAARNAGWRAARGTWVWFVDDDELAPPDRLRRLVAHLEADAGLVALGGPVRESAPPRFRTCARCSLGAIELPTDEREATWRLLAGHMVVRRAAFDEVGAFDEALRGIGEETEWFHRQGGRGVAYREELWLWHRKDHLGLAAALSAHYRAGRNIPRYRRRTGRRAPPSLRAGLRSLAHAVRRRCWKGVLTAVREAGHAVGDARQRRGGPPDAPAARDSG